MSGTLRATSIGAVVLGWIGAFGCQSPPPSGPRAPYPPPPALTQTPVAPAAPVASVADAEVHNPSRFPREKEPVYFSYYDLGVTAEDPRTKRLAVKSGETVVPSQPTDENRDGAPDGVLALVDFAPAEKKNLSIVEDEKASAVPTAKLTQAEFSAKVGGKWQPRKDKPNLKEYVGGTFTNMKSFTAPPEHTDHSNLIRYEGPGIESDKVAYRVYLDWRNGFDIFGKKTKEPVLQQVGLDGFESYHHMADWGMDIFKVGQSLGAGGFGFFGEKKQVELVSAVDQWSVDVTENGNLASAFRIRYQGWNVAKKKLDLDAHFSMTGGSRLVRTRLKLGDELPNLVVGMVKHPGTELLAGPTNVTGTAYTYAASFGKQTLNNDDLLGVAVLFEKGARSSQEDDGKNYASVMKPAGKVVDYYFLAAWSGEPGGITTKEQFVEYLERERERLTMPPRVRLKTKLSQGDKQGAVTAESALSWAKRLADSELARKTLDYRHDGWDANRKRKPKFEYDIVGLQPLAYDELAKVAPDPKYASVVEKVTGSYVTDTGEIREYDEKEYNLDAVNPGRNLLTLYERTKQEKYRKAVDVLRGQLKRQPRTTEGAFWHKKKYPSQLWLDGVYMGFPFLAKYSAMFEQGKSFDEVVNEFALTRKHLRNADTGLYFHAWDETKKQEWADPKTGRSKFYWGRGLGWFSMALLDVLDVIPESDTKHRQPLIDIVRELAPALKKFQDPATGTWWQVMDRPDALGNYRESSSSAMFTYFFAKATRNGYLDASYKDVAVASFDGLVREFVTVHADGKISMTNQCLVGGLGYGRDGSYEYYMSEPVAENDPKGNGPFILAGVEVYRLLGGKN
ncbi:MAG TPA: glycoside hydrolase family 88 protein [Polyangiaceae bacterium]